MLKEIGEKLHQLNDDEYKKMEFSFVLIILLIFCLGFFIGNLSGNINTQNEITDKLIELSNKEGLNIPDNNYFKIDNRIYEIRKVNTSTSIFDYDSN